jgi:type IV pilus assembly protein PilN
MAKINLLPWRQERRKELQRQFFTLVGLSSVLIMVLVLAVYFEYTRQISVQQSRNKYLQDYSLKLDDQIKEVSELEAKKSLMEQRMEAIKTLQRNRPEMVHLFDELVRIIPEGVHLQSLKQSSNNLDLIGYAQSNARVSSFMRNIDQSMWFTEPQLISIEEDQKSKEASIKFTLKAKHVNKTEQAAAAVPGQAPTIKTTTSTSTLPPTTPTTAPTSIPTDVTKPATNPPSSPAAVKPAPVTDNTKPLPVTEGNKPAAEKKP